MGEDSEVTPIATSPPSTPILRLIPVLLLKNGLLVRSSDFRTHQDLGNPLATIKRLSSWNVDEIVLLDISEKDGKHDFRRNDLHEKLSNEGSLSVLSQLAEQCMSPLTYGGNLSSLEQIASALRIGADKCVLTSAIVIKPELISQSAERFGSQAVVAGIDYTCTSGKPEVMIDRGRRRTGLDPIEWARQVVDRGAGEIFLQSIDNDGSALGFDLGYIEEVSSAVSVPVVCCGGAGNFAHFESVARETSASAIAAANIFHFTEISYPQAKHHLIKNGLSFRATKIASDHFPREPIYNRQTEIDHLNDRLDNAFNRPPQTWPQFKVLNQELPKVSWCRNCTFPSLAATPLEFSSDGVCTGCQMAEARNSISQEEWERRKKLFQDEVERAKSRDGSRHDVIIAVSGGKDSYFQVHSLIEDFGANPLLVTYDGNNWTPEGWRNLSRMREVFNVDHLIIRPSVSVLKMLNLAAFFTMGDMNWHAHIGIMTAPMAEAIRRKIPLVIYGEHGYSDLSGQFGNSDFPEVTYRHRLEHCGRSYEWTYFRDVWNIPESDLQIWKYPSDVEIQEVGLRGLFLGNYIPWKPHHHTKLVSDLYQFESATRPFDRTYRLSSNLDDMHENGVHDYLKYIKFGYGRATDHTSKDIRDGIMSRAQGIELIKLHDHIKPSDLERWLDYVGIDEETFDKISDTFRDPRVWRFYQNQWTRRLIT